MQKLQAQQRNTLSLLLSLSHFSSQLSHVFSIFWMRTTLHKNVLTTNHTPSTTGHAHDRREYGWLQQRIGQFIFWRVQTNLRQLKCSKRSLNEKTVVRQTDSRDDSDMPIHSTPCTADIATISRQDRGWTFPRPQDIGRVLSTQTRHKRGLAVHSSKEKI